MAYSEAFNGYIAYKRQSALDAQATGAGTLLPVTGGQGGVMTKANIPSRIVRPDGLQRRGRHGSQRASGTHAGELTINGVDDIIEDIVRGTWSSSDLTITQATTLNGSAAITSVTTGTSTIIGAAGSWITQGLRVGDIIRLSGFPDAANNLINLRIISLTASTISVIKATGIGTPLVANAAADTSFSVVRTGRVLNNPQAGSLVKRYFTLEEHEYDLDTSEVFTNCVWNRLRLSMQADGMITFEAGWVNNGRFEQKSAGSAPHFSSVSYANLNVPLAAMEATVRLNNFGVVLDLTAFDITVERATQTPSTTGPLPYAPDVFMGSLQVSGSMTFLRNDIAPMTDFLQENTMIMSLICQENEPTQANFFSLFLGNFTLGGIEKSELNKDGGARTTTARIDSALVGIDDRGGSYENTMIRFQTK